jgi:hypothetical protein
MCHLYIVYYQFLNDYPVFIYSGLPWTTIRNECNRWMKWLDSDEARGLPTSDYTSSSFWKRDLPPYRKINQNQAILLETLMHLKMILLDGAEYESEMVSNLNI